MSRRLVNLTLDTLEDIPRPCRSVSSGNSTRSPLSAPALPATQGWRRKPGCRRPCSSGVRAASSSTPTAWPAGFAPVRPAGVHAPVYGISDISGLCRCGTADVGPRHRPVHRGGLGRMLIQGVARDLTKRGVKAIEAFGDAKSDEDSDTGLGASGRCLAPADFFLSVGFKTVRASPEVPTAAPGAPHCAVLEVRCGVRAGEVARLDEP